MSNLATDVDIAALRAAAQHPFKGPNDTDASMLRSAAQRLDGGYPPGGQHTTDTVSRVLHLLALTLGSTGCGPDLMTAAKLCAKRISPDTNQRQMAADALRDVADLLDPAAVQQVAR